MPGGLRGFRRCPHRLACFAVATGLGPALGDRKPLPASMLACSCADAFGSVGNANQALVGR
eukprot:11053516-Alexandrium_andersonii.AAC.1